MKRAKRTEAASGVAGQRDPMVVAMLGAMEHPLKADIEAVREAILGVDPTIHEAVKWNAPSFRTTDFFATFNLRSQDGVQLVFHMGAKVKATATTGVAIADPARLATWLARDRCLVTLGAGAEVVVRKAAFEDFVRAWIRHV